MFICFRGSIVRRSVSCFGPFPRRSRNVLQDAQWRLVQEVRSPSSCLLWKKTLSSLLLSSVFVLSVSATTVKPEIEAQPASLELSFSDKSASVFVVVKNPGDSALKSMRLSWLASPRLKVDSAVSLKLQQLASHAEYVWELTVAPSQPRGQIAETLYLRLDYADASSNTLVPQVVFQQIPIKSKDVESVNSLVDVQVKTTLTSLESTRSGVVYLLITNKSVRSIFVNNIAVIGKPDFVDISLQTKAPEVKPPAVSVSRKLLDSFHNWHRKSRTDTPLTKSSNTASPEDLPML